MSSHKAICFDLDGTLLPMDLDDFLKDYFGALRLFAERHGQDGDRFMAGINAGVKSMLVHDDGRTNKEAFWDTMYDYVDPSSRDWEALLMTFYTEEFPRLGEGFQGYEEVAPMIEGLVAKGYPLVLTTMPLFPLTAVESRLRWAGVNPANFSRITHYENTRFSKPGANYYRENLTAMGLEGKDVLMVGNNTVEDLAFCSLGADGYILTNCLIDPVDFDLSTIKHSTMAEFAEWASNLPPCENPAGPIFDGCLDLAQCGFAFES